MRFSVIALFCRTLIVTMAFALVLPGQGLADDKGKGGKPPKKEKHSNATGKKNKGHSSPSDITVNVYFTDKHRNVMRSYYREGYQSGHCPPGLAKKNNGCMPPGQAKKWRLGYPVPHDVVVYDLPPAIIYQLGPPPAGHRYIRVASDILMIAVGTGLIVDAIQDLNDL